MTCFLLFFHSVRLLASSFQFCLYPIFLTGSRSLIWPGGDLLSHALRRSTIGAEDFHGRVRDGIGWDTLAITTRPPKGDAKHRCQNLDIVDVYIPAFYQLSDAFITTYPLRIGLMPTQGGSSSLSSD